MTELATDTPAPDIAGAVEKLLPTLFENARRCEEQRWVVDENLRLLEDAGVFAMNVPREFGGTGSSLADQVAVVSAVSSACTSTGWTVGLWAGGTWLASRFPLEARREVFTDPSTRVSGVFSPTGSLTPVDGGYVLNGAWRWNTGCRAAHWDGMAAMLPQPEGPPVPMLALVPSAELNFVDDWYAFGACGTGSSQTTATDLFVPAHRVMSIDSLLAGETRAEDGGPLERDYAMFLYITVANNGFYTGAARGALNAFLKRIPGRGLTYTPWTDQTQHPATQVAVSRAVVQIEAAEGLVDRVVGLMQNAVDTGTPLTVQERAYVRGLSGYVVDACRETVCDLFRLSGASAIMFDVPIQRYYRDVEALSLHAVMNSDANAEVHGRVVLGLDPGTAFL